MTDLGQLLATLRRPRLLVRAARHGVQSYERERDLKHILRARAAEGEAANYLISEENRLEDTRRRGEATYSIQSHVAVLTALIAEARRGVAGPATA